MKTPTIKDIRAAADARRRRRLWRARLLKLALGAVVAAVAFGFWGLPPVMRSQLQTRLEQQWQRPVTVERVRVNPLRLAVMVEGFAVADRDGAPLLAWDRLRVNFNGWSWLTGAAHFEEVELAGFAGHLRLDATGRLNFSDLIPPTEGGRTAGEPWPVVVDQLVVTDARLSLEDHSRAVPFETEVGPVTFRLDGFHTQRGEAQAPYAFNARTAAGEALAWRGTLSFARGRSEGAFEITQLALPRYQPYLGASFGGEVTAGTLDVSGSYVLDWSGPELALRWSEGRLAVQGLAVGDPGTLTPKVTLDELKIEEVNADLGGRTARVRSVKLAGASVHATMTPAGVDVLAWLPRGSTSAPARPWKLTVAEFTGEKTALDWTDSTEAGSVQIGLRDVAWRVADFATVAMDQAIPLSVQATSADGGTLVITGEVTPGTRAVAVDINLLEWALAPIAGYVADQLPAPLQRGALAVTGRATGAWPALDFSGTVSVGNFALGAADAALVSWTRLGLSGLEVATSPWRVTLARLDWVDPVVSLTVGPEGETNWLSKTSAPAEAKVAVPVGMLPPLTSPQIAVAEVVLENAALRFTDTGMAPRASLGLEKLSGTLRGLSSAEPAKGQIDLRGVAPGNAPVAVRGQFNPLGQPATIDAEVSLARVDLRPMAPYFAKYAGYRLGGGRLSLDTRVNLEEPSLDTETVVTIDGLTLGERAPGPDATKLPVGLAIALLKDRQGQIVIDLPVAGRLDDPEFRIGRVVGRVLGNLLTKAATAPFALLGGLMGGGNADLSHIDFAAGAGGLSADSERKLDALATALNERPALQLSIRGEFDALNDAAALRAAEFEGWLRVAAWRVRGGGAGEPPVDFVPSGAERETAIGNLFAARFPQAIEALVAAAPPAVGAPAAAEPRDETLLGWLREVFGGNKSRPVEPAATSLPTGVGAVPALPVAEMERQLRESIEPSQTDLTELATRRAIMVQDGLLARQPDLANRLSLRPVAAGSTDVALELN